MKTASLGQEIHQQLDTIVFQGYLASLDEHQARWRELLDQAGGLQGLRDFALLDVQRLLSTGWALSMSAGDYREAIRLIEAVLQHPDFDRSSACDRAEMMGRHAESLLYAGEVEEAAAVYRAALELVKDRLGHSQSLTIRIWARLRDYCLAQSETTSAPPALAKLIYEVVSRRSARIRRSSPRYEPREGARYAELLAPIAMVDKRG